jgi:hypothetical protein
MEGCHGDVRMGDCERGSWRRNKRCPRQPDPGTSFGKQGDQAQCVGLYDICGPSFIFQQDQDRPSISSLNYSFLNYFEFRVCTPNVSCCVHAMIEPFFWSKCSLVQRISKCQFWRHPRGRQPAQPWTKFRTPCARSRRRRNGC